MQVKSKTFVSYMHKDILSVAEDFASAVGKENLITISENHNFIRIWYWDDGSTKIQELENAFPNSSQTNIFEMDARTTKTLKILTWVFILIFFILILLSAT